jgi:hypothetical protein
VIVKIAGMYCRLAFSPNELRVQSPLRAEMFPRAISVSSTLPLPKPSINLIRKEQAFKVRFRYRRTLWWKFVHYNYFHKQLFKKYYIQKRRKPFSDKEIKKYELYKKLDDLITLRKVDWLRDFIWRLEP